MAAEGNLYGDLRRGFGIEQKVGTNLPNFTGGLYVAGSLLSTTELGYIDGVTAGTVTASKALVVGSSKELGSLGTLTMADAGNIVVNTTTGTKIGTAVGQKLGFWNATPIVQPAHANQAAITQTLAAVTGTYSTDDDAILADLTSLFTLVTAMRTALVNAGLMKGAA